MCELRSRSRDPGEITMRYEDGVIKKLSEDRYGLVGRDTIYAVMHVDDLVEWLGLWDRFVRNWEIGEERSIWSIIDGDD